MLSGGFYVRDGYRAVSTFTGAVLAALGLLVALLAGLGANRGVVGGLFALTAVVGVVAVGEGLILFVAYRDKQQQATENAPVNESPPVEPQPDPVARQAADGAYSVSCGSGGCFENGTPVYPVSKERPAPPVERTANGGPQVQRGTSSSARRPALRGQ